MQKKKKKLAGLVILAVIVLGLCGALVGVRRWAEADKEAQTTVYEELTPDLTADEIASIAYTDLEGTFRTFTKTDDGWTWEEEPDETLDDDAMESFAAGVTGVSIYHTLEDVTDLEQYGLAEPAMTATITATDGTSHDIVIGDVNDSTGGVYVCLDGETSTVYNVASGLRSTLNTEIDSLLAEEEESTASDAESTESAAESTESTAESTGSEG